MNISLPTLGLLNSAVVHQNAALRPERESHVLLSPPQVFRVKFPHTATASGILVPATRCLLRELKWLPWPINARAYFNEHVKTFIFWNIFPISAHPAPIQVRNFANAPLQSPQVFSGHGLPIDEVTEKPSCVTST